MRHLPLLVTVIIGSGTSAEIASAEPPWRASLTSRLQEIEERFEGRIGVYVHHLARNESLSYHADEPWYLASGVKVPIAIAVLGDIEEGRLSLDTTVRLKDSDFVDGAGQTNAFPAGTPLTIAYLLEQMIIYSDNTAADVLIRTVGLERVNAVAAELLTSGKLVITSLADVRRRTYAMLDPRAESLSSAQLLKLRRIRDPEKRVLALARMLGVERQTLLVKDLDAAFDAYYAAGLNSAPLKDYALMLVALANGVALTPPNTAYLLDLMTRVRTGQRRIQASLPAASSFAHKTGTQHRRVCDLGIVTTRALANEVKVVLAACAMNTSRAVSERALRDVGAAVAASGVLTLSASVPAGEP